MTNSKQTETICTRCGNPALTLFHNDTKQGWLCASCFAKEQKELETYRYYNNFILELDLANHDQNELGKGSKFKQFMPIMKNQVLEIQEKIIELKNAVEELEEQRIDLEYGLIILEEEYDRAINGDDE